MIWTSGKREAGVEDTLAGFSGRHRHAEPIHPIQLERDVSWNLLNDMERDLAPDWILKETLALQSKAIMDYANGQKPKAASDGKGLTLTVLGCGTMGIAILGGILDSISSTSPDNSQAKDEATPTRLPTTFNACVRRDASAKRIQSELGKYPAFANVKTCQNDNVRPTQDANVILLGCKPQMVSGILQAEGMLDALAGKLLISICAGVPEEQIASYLPAKHCTIVRAMPNTAAAVRESMTVIGTTSQVLDDETNALITWMFTRIGRVAHLPSTSMDAVTALCGSGPAFCALMADGLAAGAIAMGVPRDEAYLMAAQTMRGTTGLLLGGEHPAILKDKVTTPGGCTIGGLLVLEEGAVKGTIAKAVREATVVASQLGQGKQGVNGTRRG